ncbi:MAG: hypothetical protein JO111_19340 [Caulobacteraceae bacterium]|nr:hypothetical protein [Caulobacteraceae bacterium]
MRTPRAFAFIAGLLIAALLAGCGSRPGHVLDEAQRAGRTAASFPQGDEDYFHDMDRGVALTPDEVKGRNMWLVWTGGNDRFWDKMTGYTFGAFDLLKIVTSHPGQKFNRDTRWQWLGLINEPCFRTPTGPDPKRYGLWLDVRDPGCPPDPFENEAKYPGVRIGARGKTVPVGSYFGYATGIVGLRLFPNPDFDAKAAKRWDPVRYYTDYKYYTDPKLVRPYRVGMSCGFCHVGPSPTRPPADPEHPTFANLSSTVGAQYMWVDRLFIYDANAGNFMYQLVHTYRPGSMDTSLVSTDNINNPRTMNAIYLLGPRLQQALRWGREDLEDGQRNNKQFNDYLKSGALLAYFKAPGTTYTPRILKDGSDSVGALGALNRVYLNIGLFSEEWLLHFKPVVGGRAISPIPIATAERNSAYWRATEAGTPLTAMFFLKSTGADHLADAPGGSAYLETNAALLDRGKTVFAETCARCHSSKQPPMAPGLDPGGCAGPQYLACFSRYWAWTKTEDYKAKMRAIVHAPDFLDGNYLSTEARIPVTLLRTNICSPLATNALAGNIWDNFSSQSYKTLPSVGEVTLTNPFTGVRWRYRMPAGGRGYTRPPSLVSLWSTAPFLLNNSLGPFNGDPSVAGRMKVFDASIEQMLWPEKRVQDPVLGARAHGWIDRTTTRSQVVIPASYVPDALRPLQSLIHQWAPWFIDSSDEVTLGPVPAGVPVNLIANTQLLAEGADPAKHYAKLLDLARRAKSDLAKAPANATDAELLARFANLGPSFLALDKCPDFVVNRGHLFGTAAFNHQEGLSDDERAWGNLPELSDDDRKSLIAYLKTF